jgi:hypothetical protein
MARSDVYDNCRQQRIWYLHRRMEWRLSAGKSFLTVGLAVILTALAVLALAQRYS